MGMVAKEMSAPAHPPFADPRQQIEDLEDELGALNDAAERCRKTMLAAKLIVATGSVSLGLGLARAEVVALVLGIAAIFGALALWGSTRSTRDAILASLRVREQRRAELIDALGVQEIQAP